MFSCSLDGSNTLVNFQPELLRFAGQFSAGVNIRSREASRIRGRVPERRSETGFLVAARFLLRATKNGALPSAFMPKPVPADSLDRLLSLLATQSQGIGIDALARAFLPPVPRRTLQRWLARLVAARKVLPVGSARALRYRCASYASNEPARVFNLAEPGADSTGAHIPVSNEGEEVRAYVRRPREQRRPAAYTIAFLEQNHPNRTHYLPDALRRQLHQMGRSSAQGAAAGTFARDILGRLLIDLSWASSRLEGNTYSLLDTERLFRCGQAADGKDALEKIGRAHV